jgi:hypothetical protein
MFCASDGRGGVHVYGSGYGAYMRNGDRPAANALNAKSTDGGGHGTLTAPGQWEQPRC